MNISPSPKHAGQTLTSSMRFLFSILFVVVYARSDSRMIDELVESTVTLVSQNLDLGVSQWLDQITFPTESSRDRILKYVQDTFIRPTLTEERSLIKRELHQMLDERNRSIHPLKIFYSISHKIIHAMQANALKWAQDQKHMSYNIGLTKRSFAQGDDPDEYRFPHLFDETGILSGLMDIFFYSIALMPLYNMFDNTSLKGSFQVWLIQNFMISPLYNRLMYGYYLYEPDDVEYFE